ncbi:unnamed protein product [Amoebophrya sp. A120]|nr:unnamed protein product [Amoebophrya sp. A120]|eukprot:GSA120T00023211001.1
MPARFLAMSLVCHLSTVAVVSALRSRTAEHREAVTNVGAEGLLAYYEDAYNKHGFLRGATMKYQVKRLGEAFNIDATLAPQLREEEVQNLLFSSLRESLKDDLTDPHPWYYFLDNSENEDRTIVHIFKHRTTSGSFDFPAAYWTISLIRSPPISLTRPGPDQVRPFGITLEYKSATPPSLPLRYKVVDPPTLRFGHKAFLAALVINGHRDQAHLRFTAHGTAMKWRRFKPYDQVAHLSLQKVAGRQSPWRNHAQLDTFVRDFRDLWNMHISSEQLVNRWASMINSYAAKPLVPPVCPTRRALPVNPISDVVPLVPVPFAALAGGGEWVPGGYFRSP